MLRIYILIDIQLLPGRCRPLVVANGYANYYQYNSQQNTLTLTQADMDGKYAFNVTANTTCDPDHLPWDPRYFHCLETGEWTIKHSPNYFAVCFCM